jgi:hypothetical protein
MEQGVDSDHESRLLKKGGGGPRNAGPPHLSVHMLISGASLSTCRSHVRREHACRPFFSSLLVLLSHKAAWCGRGSEA